MKYKISFKFKEMYVIWERFNKIIETVLYGNKRTYKNNIFYMCIVLILYVTYKYSYMFAII